MYLGPEGLFWLNKWGLNVADIEVTKIKGITNISDSSATFGIRHIICIVRQSKG